MSTRSPLPRAFLVRYLREWLYFDNVPFRAAIGAGALAAALCFLLLRKTSRGTELLASTHRGNFSAATSRFIERLFRRAIVGRRDFLSTAIRREIYNYPTKLGATPHTKRFFQDPGRLLNGCILVLKSPGRDEKGVLYLYYSYVYPLFLKMFNLAEIEKRYRIVAEPSWSGYCDLNILSLSRLSNQVFIGSIEPRDTELLNQIGDKFVPVMVGGNTWIDPEVFRPLPSVIKDVDIVYVGSWADYKRHWAFFRALATLKARGRSLKVVLIGYRIDLSADDIVEQARQFGVDDLLEIRERLTPQEVNLYLNRSKINLIWSRKEGVNRAIIEGMAAGTPCIVRAGFNYGHHYPYINESTGTFSSEIDLPDVIERMLENYRSFSPRDSVVPLMTPAGSTMRLNSDLRDSALRAGEQWTRDIEVRVGTIDGLAYRSPEIAASFSDDYAFLRSQIIPRNCLVWSNTDAQPAP